MRRGNLWYWLALFSLFAFPAMVSAQAAKSSPPDLTEGDLNVGHGQVDWTERTITATGSGAPDLKAANVAVARLGAERVAKLDALRNILETLKGVRINSEVTVQNEMVTNEKMRTTIEGVARHFKVLRTKYYSDGGVDLVVQMSLDGELASALIKSGAKTSELSNATGQPKNTGLIIDARGIGVIPALAPRVLNESGTVLYSSDYVDPKSLEANGVVGYFRNLDSAKKNARVAAEPLVIKALKHPADSKTDIVISNVDAGKLQGKDTNIKYLTEGKVIIVVD
jgi:hypothetical protein